MTRDDILRMAREAGIPAEKPSSTQLNWIELDRFAELVAAAERERCAKVCEATVSAEPNAELGLLVEEQNEG